jgi:hypothetical protein
MFPAFWEKKIVNGTTDRIASSFYEILLHA